MINYTNNREGRQTNNICGRCKYNEIRTFDVLYCKKHFGRVAELNTCDYFDQRDTCGELAYITSKQQLILDAMITVNDENGWCSAKEIATVCGKNHKALWVLADLNILVLDGIVERNNGGKYRINPNKGMIND